MSAATEPLRAERVLLHPLWLGSLALLVANDHFFKGAGILHHVATGKLSDFAGLVVAPALLAVLLRARTRAHLALCHAATGIVFALTEISPLCARALEQAMTIAGVPWRLVPDLTDLLALPALALGWHVLVPAMEREVEKRRASPILRGVCGTVGFLACVGTSQVQEPPPVPPPPPPPAPAVMPAQDLGALLGHTWRATNADGSWQLTYRFDSDGRYAATGQPAWQESGRVELVAALGNTLTVRFTDRQYEDQRDEASIRALELSDDGQSFVMGSDRFVRVDGAKAVAEGE
jgi:hypothetical protein